MKQYYYTYKITLLKGSLANHYYFGQHQTDNLDDGYCGSGVKLKKYYNKYGTIEGETYIKEILSFYNNLDELNQAEFELIGDKYENDPMCLNLAAGGNIHTHCSETKQKISNSTKGHPSYLYHQSEEARKKISEHHRTNYHSLSEETKKKISEKMKGHNMWKDDEYKEKQRQSRLGRSTWNKGLTKEQMQEYRNKKKAA